MALLKRTEISSKKINRNALAGIIYKRLEGLVSKQVIVDISFLIENFLIEKILANEAVSIDNFGTIAPCSFFNVEKFGKTISYNMVRFFPHSNFTQMVQNRKEDLLERKNNNV